MRYNMMSPPTSRELNALVEALMNDALGRQELAARMLLLHLGADAIGLLEWVEGPVPCTTFEALDDRRRELRFRGDPDPIWRLEIRWRAYCATLHETWLRPEYAVPPVRA